MKKFISCFIALAVFFGLFSLSFFSIRLFNLSLETSDLIGLLGAIATLFGALVIIFSFSQWKEQANIQLTRDLALKCTDALAEERDCITQIYSLMKVNYISYRQFSPEIFETISEDTTTIFESSWEHHVDSSSITQRNCNRIIRINNDNDLKFMFDKYKSLSRFLTERFEYIFTFKCETPTAPLISDTDFDTYVQSYLIIDKKFDEFKKISNEIDEYLDLYIVIKE